MDCVGSGHPANSSSGVHQGGSVGVGPPPPSPGVSSTNEKMSQEPVTDEEDDLGDDDISGIGKYQRSAVPPDLKLGFGFGFDQNQIRDRDWDWF